MKAFDTISHKLLWNALEQFGIEPQYISLLRRLHADQQATVLTDKEKSPGSLSVQTSFDLVVVVLTLASIWLHCRQTVYR